MHQTESRKEKRKGKGEQYHKAAKKMPLVSGMILGIAEASLASKKAKNGDKIDMFAKRVVRSTSPEVDPGESAW